ncbi:MAG TPA: SLATT domain-containing protein [Azospirillum sp.]|nr:SLATT domain-containing protein [Azospirillum sp.]
MNKNDLLKSIAETGYNVGFGAKKHFATYDLVEKVPGWIGFASIAFGVYGLVIERLSNKMLGATMVMLGICSLYIYFYDAKKMEYERAGRDLTQIYNRLRDLYRTVQGAQSSDLAPFEQSLGSLENEYYSKCISKQILFSDWYAHYKFFWQHQIEWIEEQKKFRLFRDKIPLSLMVAASAAIIIVAVLAVGE